MLQSLNNNIVCAPFEEKSSNTSLKLLPNRADLKALKVLIGTTILNSHGETTHIFKPDDTLYVSGDTKSSAWSIIRKCSDLKNKDGKEQPFVLVPFSECFLVNVNG